MANASPAMASALPVLPPTPAGPEPYFRARGLAALIAALDDAIITYEGPTGAALVVVVGGRVLDAVAVPAGRQPLIGLEALNSIGPADSAGLRAAAVDRRLALALPSYWREPDRLPPISAMWVEPAGFVEAVVRRGRRGVIVLRSPADFGLVLFDESGFVAAYSQSRPQPGDLEALAGLLTDPGTVVHARMAGHYVQGSHAEGRVAALPDPIERCRGEIVHMVERTLHLHADTFVDRLRAAPASTAGLLHATEEVRGLRPRLVAPGTVASIADSAEELIRSVARGN